jgi:hypothetical protein
VQRSALAGGQAVTMAIGRFAKRLEADAVLGKKVEHLTKMLLVKT